MLIPDDKERLSWKLNFSEVVYNWRKSGIRTRGTPLKGVQSLSRRSLSATQPSPLIISGLSECGAIKIVTLPLFPAEDQDFPKRPNVYHRPTAVLSHRNDAGGGAGFEPRDFRQRFSRPPPSTTRPSLHHDVCLFPVSPHGVIRSRPLI